jgi:hypothetical protein
MPPMKPGRARYKRRALTGLGITAAALGAVAVAWWCFGGSFAGRVESEVRAGVPLGSIRADAEQWVRRTYGVQPAYFHDATGDQFVGRTVPDLAGIPADGLAGFVRTTVTRRGILRNIPRLFDYDQVFVYFLIDRNDRVCGYYFLSLAELRDMEVAHAEKEPRTK